MVAQLVDKHVLCICPLIFSLIKFAPPPNHIPKRNHIALCMHFPPFSSSPHHGVKVMSVGCLLEERDSAVVWRGPRKTALIKRFVKDTFWGRLDYLIFDILCSNIQVHVSYCTERQGVAL